MELGHQMYGRQKGLQGSFQTKNKLERFGDFSLLKNTELNGKEEKSRKFRLYGKLYKEFAKSFSFCEKAFKEKKAGREKNYATKFMFRLRKLFLIFDKKCTI